MIMNQKVKLGGLFTKLEIFLVRKSLLVQHRIPKQDGQTINHAVITKNLMGLGCANTLWRGAQMMMVKTKITFLSL